MAKRTPHFAQPLQASFIGAKNNTTRSPANIITKNAAKHTLIANTRLLAGLIQKLCEGGGAGGYFGVDV